MNHHITCFYVEGLPHEKLGPYWGESRDSCEESMGEGREAGGGQGEGAEHGGTAVQPGLHTCRPRVVWVSFSLSLAGIVRENSLVACSSRDHYWALGSCCCPTAKRRKRPKPPNEAMPQQLELSSGRQKFPTAEKRNLFAHFLWNSEQDSCVSSYCGCEAGGAIVECFTGVICLDTTVTAN